MSVDARPQLFQDLSQAVLVFDEDKVVAIADQVVANGLDAYEAIEQGLSHGMERAGELFDQDEYFVPELLLCADAMYAGIDVLKPHVPLSQERSRGKVVIGVIEGDTHDIGKNLVRILLVAAGFELFDLGRDVPPERFVDKALEVDADIIAVSTLMTTTMEGMAQVVRLLDDRQVRDRFKVIVGGAPISQGYAKNIGADGYASNAAHATKLARQLVTAGAAPERAGELEFLVSKP